MSIQCPLLYRQVDATVTRINTLFVMIGVVAFLVTKSIVIPAVLVIDLLLRLYGYKSFSPIQRTSLWMQKRLSLPSKMEDAGGKRLAAFFGVVFTSALIVLEWLGMEWGVYIVAVLFLGCAGLELVFGFCVACKLYGILRLVCPERIG